MVDADSLVRRALIPESVSAKWITRKPANDRQPNRQMVGTQTGKWSVKKHPMSCADVVNHYR